MVKFLLLGRGLNDESILGEGQLGIPIGQSLPCRSTLGLESLKVLVGKVMKAIGILFQVQLPRYEILLNRTGRCFGRFHRQSLQRFGINLQRFGINPGNTNKKCTQQNPACKTCFPTSSLKVKGTDRRRTGPVFSGRGLKKLSGAATLQSLSLAASLVSLVISLVGPMCVGTPSIAFICFPSKSCFATKSASLPSQISKLTTDESAIAAAKQCYR